jgi:hypothetical protein
MKASSFEFVSYNLNQRIIELKYKVHFEDSSALSFTEKITLPQQESSLSSDKIPAVDSLLHTLHLMCGMSYWKLYCPPSIQISTKPLSQQQAEFWNTVYTKGLGEFFYRNTIKLQGLVQFPYQEESGFNPEQLPLQNRSLMGVGGGKDSIVTFELLKKLKQNVTAFVLETQKDYQLINDVLTTMKVGALRVQREIDPLLFAKNKENGTYNGHIPITGIYSTIALLCAVLYDYQNVIMSNERSANYGNVKYDGIEINHQWSKSAEFEKLFQEYIYNNVSPSLQYFSLLRPWSELQIIQEFTKYPEYFFKFSSCNNNFKITPGVKQSVTKLWCGHCPKCAFIFSLLSAYLPKDEVVKIFGKNLYADEQLIPLYKELLGIKDFKPFECVGTPEEVSLAFSMASAQGEYKDNPLMKMFEKEVKPRLHPEQLKKEVFRVGDVSLMPALFKTFFSTNHEN